VLDAAGEPAAPVAASASEMTAAPTQTAAQFVPR
jgi:hypothetical protein